MHTENSPKGKTILVIEDNELNMTLWNDVLEAQGYALFGLGERG
jgi:CheY-like chemotaxis protein